MPTELTGQINTRTVDVRLVDQFASSTLGVTITLSLFLFALGTAISVTVALAVGVTDPVPLGIMLAVAITLALATGIFLGIEGRRCRKAWKAIQAEPGLTATFTPQVTYGGAPPAATTTGGKTL
jgi:hypothetical protein